MGDSLNRHLIIHTLMLSALQLVAPHVVAGAVFALPQALPSVKEQFRTFSGERTPDAYKALFELPADPIRQQPRVAMSDGKTAVILAIKLPDAGGNSPNFSLKNATLLELQKKGGGEWVLKVMPAKDTSDCVLVVAAGGLVRDYPLAVSPKASREIRPVIEGFEEFLKESRTVCMAVHDLNADGRCDYIDDYIFTANYIQAESLVGRSKDARRQRALQRTLSTQPQNSTQPAPTSGTVTDPGFNP